MVNISVIASLVLPVVFGLFIITCPAEGYVAGWSEWSDWSDQGLQFSPWKRQNQPTMSDFKRQLESQTEVQTEEIETELPQSEESRNGDVLFSADGNSEYSLAHNYNWKTALPKQKLTDDQNNDWSLSDGKTQLNKRNEIKAEEVKENTDPSPNGQQNTENYKHDTAVLFLL